MPARRSATAEAGDAASGDAASDDTPRGAARHRVEAARRAGARLPGPRRPPPSRARAVRPVARVELTMPDQRLDAALAARGLARSRTHAATLIAAGVVTVDGRPVVKPALKVAESATLEVAASDHYVSRAAHKLIAALDAFAVDPAGRIVLDAGASTGGFSQVLLERGARTVLAVDVGPRAARARTARRARPRARRGMQRAQPRSRRRSPSSRASPSRPRSSPPTSRSSRSRPCCPPSAPPRPTMPTSCCS